MIRMFNELKEKLQVNMQKQLNEYQENTGTQLKKIWKQLKEFRGDLNKFQNENKDIIRKETYEIKKTA
jgi:hypothetical protein